ncbi:MAG TPA: dockerin type I repeat-containing protein, partial [Anaerohalosphaeraceae bacterium]|nr:dockerin type I repeat-containing protein [Anaerohalosphaeraceae bacterium]
MINWGFAGCVVLIFSTMVFGGAVNPQPPIGASVDPDTLSLMWTAGTGAIRSEVYIGTNAAAVGNAQKPIGDVNGDGLVDILDLAETAAQWLAAPADPCADLNYSGRVDLADVAELSRSWGQSADVLYLGAASGNSIDPPDPISVNKTY